MEPELNPGNMQGTADASTQIPADFASSMAAAIENALVQLLGLDHMTAFPVQTNSSDARSRRRLFIAIAQGVVSHLVANAGAFQVTGTDSTGQPITASVSINTSGTLSGL